MTCRFSALSSTVLLAMIACVLLLAPRAHAQTTTHVEKRSTRTVIKETESDHDDDEDDYDDIDPAAFHRRPKKLQVKESVITSKFGSKGQTGMMGCKTEEVSETAVKDLKGDCNSWIKDQKADLKDRYLTSSCEEVCEDCGTGLKRCSVTGSVHYLVK